MWTNKIILHVFSVCTGSNCCLQYQPMFSKPVTFYGVKIAEFMPRIRKKVSCRTLPKRPTLPETSHRKKYKQNNPLSSNFQLAARDLAIKPTQKQYINMLTLPFESQCGCLV